MTLSTNTAKNTRMLTPGDLVGFQGREFVIIKTNTAKYVIADRETTKQYSINRRAPLTFLGRDEEAMVEAMRARTEREMERQGIAADEHVGVTPEGRARFSKGQRVRVIGKGATELLGAVGVVERVNPKRYSVRLDGHSEDGFLVPFTMVERETKN